LNSYWNDVLKYINKDIAFVYGDEVKRDFEAMETEAKRITIIFKNLFKHYYISKEEYLKEISDLGHFIELLSSIDGKHKEAWLKKVHDHLQEVIKDIKKEKTEDNGSNKISKNLLDSYIGTLIGCAVGDALGAPVESMWAGDIQKKYGFVKDYVKGNRFPKGIYTDDTQLTIAGAETFIENKGFNPETYSKKFIEWLNNPIGAGKGTVEAVERLKQGVNWTKSGSIELKGCGPAMKASPFGLFYKDDLNKLKEVSMQSTIVTHNNADSIAGATAVAYSVAYVIDNKTNFNPKKFLRSVSSFIKDISPEFSRRIALLEHLLDKNMNLVLENELKRRGAFILDTVPAALYFFVISPFDFEKSVLNAINGGGDTDSIAAITGAISGALNGFSNIPLRFVNGLENGNGLNKNKGKDYIINLAKELYKTNKSYKRKDVKEKKSFFSFFKRKKNKFVFNPELNKIKDENKFINILVGLIKLNNNKDFIKSLNECASVVIINDHHMYEALELFFDNKGGLVKIKGHVKYVEPELKIDEQYLYHFSYEGKPVGIVPLTEERLLEIKNLGKYKEEEGFIEIKRKDGRVIRAYVSPIKASNVLKVQSDVRIS
ncbi:ADP-ribosylglycohydrolase family protein, partial [Candidatus Woesearchaeota archaeon]|nr:ADP-ribosylglycohydrolase family protein [Candidatus Woesearchaeota archaeon]